MAEKYEILEEKILQAIENYDPDEIIEICSKMSDEEIKKVFDNSSIFDVLEGFEVVQICSKMSDKAKKEILYKLSSWCIMKLSQDMSIEDKIEILNNSEILKKLLGNDIAKICENMSSKEKLKQLSNPEIVKKLYSNNIAKICENMNKKDKIRILENPEIFEKLNGNAIEEICENMSLRDRIGIFKNPKIGILKNPEIFEKFDGDYIAEICRNMSKKDKIEILSNSQLAKKLGLDGVSKICYQMSDKDKLELLNNPKILENIDNSNIVSMCYRMSEGNKLKILNNSNILEKLEGEDIKNISHRMSEENKLKILNNSNILEKLDDFDIKYICIGMSKENRAKVLDISFVVEKLIDISEEKKVLIYPNSYNLYFWGTKLLEKVLDNNASIETILLSENLTDEEKRIFLEFAPNKNYSYRYVDTQNEFDSKGKQGKGELKEDCNFSEFLKADKIIEDMLFKMGSDWSEIEKFKYIYNEIGKMISYDINILYDGDKEDYNNANLNARNPFKSILTGKGVCAGYAEIYQYVCRKAGLSCSMETVAGYIGYEAIEAQNIDGNPEKWYEKSDDAHQYNVIEYVNEQGEKVKSYCDLTWDARAIKLGNKCNYFGKSAKVFGETHPNLQLEDIHTDNISEEKLIEIDKKISYVNSSEYTIENKYLQIAKESLEIKNISERVAHVLNKMVEIQSLQSMSSGEIVNFSKILLLNCGIDKENIGKLDCFVKKDEHSKREPKEILWIKDETKTEKGNNQYLYYIFNSEQQQFKNLDKETLKDLLASEMLNLYNENIWVPGLSEEKKTVRSSNIEH